MNKILSIIVLFFSSLKKKKDTDLKIPEGWRIVRDVDNLLIDASLVKIHRLQNSSDSVMVSEIFEQIVGEYQLGLKSLNSLFASQSMIPEECKNKTTLFIGTVCVDQEDRLWVPRLYHLVFQNEWRMSFFCLSVDKVSSKNDIILLADFSNN